MSFKHDDELRRIENCPPSGMIAPQCQAFRFVHEEIKDSRNFQVPAILQPGRKFKDVADECDAWGLSLFVSNTKAIEYFKRLVAKHRNIRKQIGTNLASGKLMPTDGYITPVDEAGHFSLYEVGELNLATRFAIVEPLPS